MATPSTPVTSPQQRTQTVEEFSVWGSKGQFYVLERHRLTGVGRADLLQTNILSPSEGSVSLQSVRLGGYAVCHNRLVIHGISSQDSSCVVGLANSTSSNGFAHVFRLPKPHAESEFHLTHAFSRVGSQVCTTDYRWEDSDDPDESNSDSEDGKPNQREPVLPTASSVSGSSGSHESTRDPLLNPETDAVSFDDIFIAGGGNMNHVAIWKIPTVVDTASFVAQDTWCVPVNLDSVTAFSTFSGPCATRGMGLAVGGSTYLRENVSPSLHLIDTATMQLAMSFPAQSVVHSIQDVSIPNSHEHYLLTATRVATEPHTVVSLWDVRKPDSCSKSIRVVLPTTIKAYGWLQTHPSRADPVLHALLYSSEGCTMKVSDLSPEPIRTSSEYRQIQRITPGIIAKRSHVAISSQPNYMGITKAGVLFKYNSLTEQKRTIQNYSKLSQINGLLTPDILA